MSQSAIVEAGVVLALQRPERAFDRVAHPLRRAPPDAKKRRYLVERQALEVAGEGAGEGEEGDALVPGDGAGELVGAVEGRPDDQQLLALPSALQPRAGSLEPAAMRNRGDGHRTHRRDCINPAVGRNQGFIARGKRSRTSQSATRSFGMLIYPLIFTRCRRPRGRMRFDVGGLGIAR